MLFKALWCVDRWKSKRTTVCVGGKERRDKGMKEGRREGRMEGRTEVGEGGAREGNFHMH